MNSHDVVGTDLLILINPVLCQDSHDSVLGYVALELMLQLSRPALVLISHAAIGFRQQT